MRLRIGEQLSIGRASGKGLSLTSDLHMSRVHFCLLATDTDLIIRDLNSSNGTFVNGRQISAQTLRVDDEILAGSTRFKVVSSLSAHVSDPQEPIAEARKPLADSTDQPENAPAFANAQYEEADQFEIENAKSSDTLSAAAKEQKELMEKISAVEKFDNADKGNFVVVPDYDETVSNAMEDATIQVSFADLIKSRLDFRGKELVNELTIYRGRSGKTTFMEVTKLIYMFFPLNLIVNVKKAPRNMKSFLTSPSRAKELQWFGDKENVFLPLESGLDLFEIYEQCWGSNSVIGVFSKLDRAPLFDHFIKNEATFCEPRVAYSHLFDCSREYATQLTRGIQAVMVEKRPDDPNWTIFCGGSEGCGWKELNLPVGPR